VNLLVLVSDALRADALSCYGGPAHTPNLCALARRGVLFEHAFAAAPWTLPSSVAIGTGRSPARYATAPVEGRRSRLYRVPDSDLLLGELLSERGYDAERFIENPVALRGHAFQGFAPRGSRGPAGEGAARTLAEAGSRIGFEDRGPRYERLAWLLDRLLRPSTPGPGPGRTRECPFALLHWINDPHAEYRPPAAFLPAGEGRGLPRPLAFYTGLGHRRKPSKNLHKLRRWVPELSREELRFVHRLYLGEVESVDERVGYVLDALEASGLAGSTVVVFTADHGEAFGEHGDYLHGASLYDELVHVPLILAGPGVARGRRVETPVSQVDLVPTLVDLLGLPGEDRKLLGPFTGTSLAGLVADVPRRLPRRALYVASPERLDEEAVVEGRYKLIVDGGPGGGSVRLFDYVADPAESRSVAADRPDVRASLLRTLLARRRAARRAREAVLDGRDPEKARAERETTEKTLRAVGYLD
jgi:arylsulfatase A-like enzyme